MINSNINSVIRSKDFFRRIKRFRRIFTRYEKLDVIFLSFVYFALIVDALIWTQPKGRKIKADAIKVKEPGNFSKLPTKDKVLLIIAFSIPGLFSRSWFMQRKKAVNMDPEKGHPFMRFEVFERLFSIPACTDSQAIFRQMRRFFAKNYVYFKEK